MGPETRHCAWRPRYPRMGRAKCLVAAGNWWLVGKDTDFRSCRPFILPPSFIPEDTQIYIPPYSLHRSAEYFSPSPDKFDPDRWLRDQKPDEVLNVAAFIPFSYGAANCVGKSLAWREMLMVTSTLVKKFDIRFADGFQSENWLGNLRDVFITSIGGPLLVVISRR